MAGKPKTQAKQVRPAEHPPVMLPDCAQAFGIITTRLEQVTETQDKITDKIWGNGKTGMDDLIAENQRQIATLTGLVAKLVATKDEEVTFLKNEKKAREEELRLSVKRRDELALAAKIEAKKFWYSIGGALIVAAGTAGIAIWQAVETQKLLMQFIP